MTQKSDWSRYNSIIIDSVTVWVSEETEDIEPEDAQVLTDRFYDALHTQISKVMEVTDTRSFDTLKLRAAITGGGRMLPSWPTRSPRQFHRPRC